jgi:hypothetical protein
MTKYDKRFSATAADPGRRRAAIVSLSRSRTILFWCATVLTLFTLAVSIFGSRAPSFGLWLIVAIQMAGAYKIESDLRLLCVIERLQGDGKIAG